MCVVVAKYFPEIGWVGVKNRDRNYTPDLSFRKQNNKNTEVLYFWDDITQYCEGMNDSGICILSASLMVLDDEKEITIRSKTPSKDGVKIKKALELTDIKAVAMSLIKQKLPGCTIIFNQETCYLLEGAWEPGGYEDEEYRYKIREIPHDETVARTNHGIWLDWAGYQHNDEDSGESMSAVSSRARQLIAQKIVDDAETPAQLIDNLTKKYVDNWQLNAMRLADEKKMMRTTAQLMLVPKDSTMFVRPIQSNITFNFWKLNKPGSKLWVELLSNRVLRTGDSDPEIPSNLSHIEG